MLVYLFKVKGIEKIIKQLNSSHTKNHEPKHKNDGTKWNNLNWDNIALAIYPLDRHAIIELQLFSVLHMRKATNYQLISYKAITFTTWVLNAPFLVNN